MTSKVQTFTFCITTLLYQDFIRVNCLQLREKIYREYLEVFSSGTLNVP